MRFTPSLLIQYFLLASIPLAICQDNTPPQIFGIGYFQQTNDYGVNYCSFAGGTEIMIQGIKIDPTPSNNDIQLVSSANQNTFDSPALSNSNVFRSQASDGKLQYTLPSITTLLSITQDQANAYQLPLSFTLQLQMNDGYGAIDTIECLAWVGGCGVIYNRAYTPILYGVNPPTAYYGSQISYWLDPRNAQSLQQSYEWPFTEARIGTSLINFEDIYDETIRFGWNTKSQIYGFIGDIAPSASNSPSMLFDVGFAQTQDAQLNHCSYDGSNCYVVQSLASIYSISATQGYTTGGQLLNIEGYGFISNTVTVEVDGVACLVQSVTVNQVSCITQSKASASVGGLLPGQNGLNLYWYNQTNNYNLANMNQLPYVQYLALHAESFQNNGTYFGRIMTGYFKPPATTTYQFYMACDDNCEMFLSTNNDPATKTQILASTSYSAFRNYYDNPSQVSAPISLTAGNYYYIEIRQMQQTGSEFVSVGVEITTSETNHPNCNKQIQRLSINPTNIREQTTVTILNPDSGSFAINIYPTHSTPSGPYYVSAKASASQMYNAINYYYTSTFGAPVTVSLTMYDVNGVVTTVASSSKKNVYTILFQQQITGATSVQWTFTGSGTSATAFATVPGLGTKSSAPLTGDFYITCTNLDGSQNYTADIPYNALASVIAAQIVMTCPDYTDKFDLWDSREYAYYSNLFYGDGRDLMIQFSNLNANPPQFTIASGQATQLNGNGIAFSSTIQQQYGQNIFYGPIPFELLYTNVTLPQVTMTLNNLPVVCATMNCNYQYIVSTAQITTFSYSGSTLTMGGTNLPTTGTTASFGENVCTITSSSSTQVLCTIAGTLVSGSWLPKLNDGNGLTPILTGINAEVIAVSVTSITPSASVNPHGGNVLTVIGNHFPQSLQDGSTISLTFADGTLCVLLTTSSTSMTCQTNAFAAASIGTTQHLTVTINGQSSSTASVAIASSVASVVSISPNNYSPVLMATLNVTFTSAYSGSYDREDFSVILVAQAGVHGNVPINVMAVDSVNHVLVCKYGGAWSGTYNVQVSSGSYGALSSSITFQAIGIVTGFSPTSGSLYGGTILTITGYTFSDLATDNAVMVGGYNCDVVSTDATSISCITPFQNISSTQAFDITVFLKLSEQAVCSGQGCNQFTYSAASVPTLTTVTPTFDIASYTYEVQFSGSNFVGTSSQVSVYIDGNEQQIISAGATMVVARLSSLIVQNTTNVQFSLLSGTPAGYTLLSNGLNFIPQLVSVSPSVGSSAGSILTLNIQGLGASVNGLSVVLGGSAHTSVCTTLTIVSYGVVECVTKAQVVAASTLGLIVNSTFSACANLDTSACAYSTGSSMPSISSVSLSTDTTQLTFTGTNFFTTGYTGIAYYLGIPSTSVVLTSNTQAVATFAKGLPLSATAIIPQLFFQVTSTFTGHYAASTITLANTASASTASSTSVSCSFAGGCNLQVTQKGLATSIANNQGSITVCGKTCVYNDAASTGTSVTCALPPLSTVYSINNYNITSSGVLVGDTTFSSTPANTWAAFDGNNNQGYTDSGSTCSIGMGFLTGYVGIVSQVKFFMNLFVKANYAGKLNFQVSQDGITYTTLFTVGQELHAGWNYYDYSDGAQLYYRFYRFHGTGVGSCNLGEIVLTGVEAINDNTNQYVCNPTVTFGTTSFALSATATFTHSLTPFLTSISPRYGNVEGGTTITFTGTNFDTTIAHYSIVIDAQVCAVTSASTTQVQCVTAPRPGLYPNTYTALSIAGYGNVATQGLTYLYVNLWSLEDTWGGEFLPTTGDTVWVPAGMHLLVDVPSTPVLDLVLVQGSLIFAPNADPTQLATFDATYIMVDEGYMEVGTEQFPYTSQLIITMHGDKFTPEQPIFGSKCIAVMMGTLDMHGVTRNPPWTSLETTANIGDTQITLNSAVDWKVGEQIVIAPTGYDSYEAEVFTIVAVNDASVNFPVLTLNASCVYKHYAGIEHYGSDTLEMRAEVGLLTRNVVYRGDPETSGMNQFGAHIMLHSSGDESLTGRIAFIELRDVGQAFQLGRYPLHFHMIGTVSNSYIQGCAIHNTYNRAITIHAVQYLRVIQNVAYNTMGHTFFIEDAIETNNLLDGNLAIQTKRSWSLLNTDQTPASFWITNPNNYFRNNHAAGSDRYGYWFDLQVHSTGPSYDPNICPINTQLGEFDNNVAHSNGRYGLRIFHGLLPLEFPCNSYTFDPFNDTDHYHGNSLITAYFTNILTYKNQINGVIVEAIGDVRFINITSADNLEANIEISITPYVMDNTATLQDSFVVGYSANSDSQTIGNPITYGVITPRSENFTVNNIRFHKYDLPNFAAIGSCSHCYKHPSTDSGARTVVFSNLMFNASNVIQKIIYQFPYRAIYYDLDGSLTGIGPGTWSTPFWPHNNVSQCTLNMAVYNGFLCDSTIQVRRLAFDAYSPSIFYGQTLNILQYDDAIIGGMNETELYNYTHDWSKYSVVEFKDATNPINGWAMPYVTGHKYFLNWGFGLDFMSMRLTLSSRWTAADKQIDLFFNFTDVRAQVIMTTGRDNITNNTLATVSNALQQTGDNVVYNDTATRLIHLLVNGKNWTRNPVVMTGVRCDGSCQDDINTTVLETTFRYWSNTSSWTNNNFTLPIAGQNIEIMSGWNMILDLNITPILGIVQINGRLSFLEDSNITLQAKYIFVRAGELYIGNVSKPYTGNAQITLYGSQENQYIVFTNTIEAGDKNLVNTGTIGMYGTSRSYLTRLAQPAHHGDNKIYVEPGLDWKAGDEIGLAPTTMIYNESDYATITNYNSATGEVDLDRFLTGYHYGAASSTGPQYSGVDIRGEVFLLTRNIKINGQDVGAWGCQVITSEFIENDGVVRSGNTVMDNVEIYNCSQYDTQMAAMRFDTVTTSWSSITNTAVHHGLGYGFIMTESANINFQNNVFFDFVNFGGMINTCANVTVDSSMIINVHPRNFTALGEEVDPRGGFVICAYVLGDVCQNVIITNNIVAGTDFYGYVAPGHNCGNTSDNTFKNNVAHSINGQGGAIFPIPGNAQHLVCYEGSYFTAYKCINSGVFAFYQTAQTQFLNMVLIDNGYSAFINIGEEGDNLNSILSNSQIYGETPGRDCFYQNQCVHNPLLPYCVDKYGATIPYASIAAKPIFPLMSSDLPLTNIHKGASYGGNGLFTNVNFYNFLSNTSWCGTQQSLLALTTEAADYIPTLTLKRSTLTNIHQSAVTYIYSPPIGWATIDDCGLFPCTGPNNVLIKFESAYITGNPTPDHDSANFQIVSNVPSYANRITGSSPCKFYSTWNAYYCEQEDLGMLVFESLDVDKMKRTFSPLIIRDNTTNFLNTLNEFMDHDWDGFYTSQLRLSRFATVVQTGYNYEILYTGTPPSNQRFTLVGETQGTMIQIKYLKSMAFNVEDVNQVPISPNSWDISMGQEANITHNTCGENRYVGVSNILQFYLTHGCTIYLAPIDAVLGMVKMNWTVEAFYADGGTTSFVDRLCAALGIHASTVRVVSVYTGSVVVQFQIYAYNNDTTALANTQAAFTRLIQTNKIFLGAPILLAQYQGSTIQTIVASNFTHNTTNPTVPSTVSSSSSSKSSGVQFANGTIIVIGNSGLNATISQSNSDGTGSSGSSSEGGVLGLTGTGSLNAAKIAGIAIVLVVVLVGLIILAVVLYRRNKKLSQYEKKPTEEMHSPDGKKKAAYYLEQDDFKNQKGLDRSSDKHKNAFDIVISEVDKSDGPHVQSRMSDGIDNSRSISGMHNRSEHPFNTNASSNPLKDSQTFDLTKFQSSSRDNNLMISNRTNAKVFPENAFKIQTLNSEQATNTVRSFMPQEANSSIVEVPSKELKLKSKGSPTKLEVNWYDINEEEQQQEQSVLEEPKRETWEE